MLQAGAVIGSRFEFDLIQAAGGRAENEVVEALEALLARQLLTKQAGRYRFNHDLIRAVVYHDLSHDRRRLLHRRVGEALQNLRANHVIALAQQPPAPLIVKGFERLDDAGGAPSSNGGLLLLLGLICNCFYAQPRPVARTRPNTHFLRPPGTSAMVRASLTLCVR
jgi:hypothetical protein